MTTTPVKSTTVIQVILTEVKMGEGSTEDPVRIAQVFHTLEGQLICAIDPKPKKANEPKK